MNFLCVSSICRDLAVFRCIKDTRKLAEADLNFSCCGFFEHFARMCVNRQLNRSFRVVHHLRNKRFSKNPNCALLVDLQRNDQTRD